MALYDTNDPLNPDSESGLERSSGRGLRMFKSAAESYQQDVVPTVNGLRGVEPTAPTIAMAGGKNLADVLGVPASPVSSSPKTLADIFGFSHAQEPAPKPEQGDFSRGFETAGKQLKQTAYGAAALIGDTVGATGLKDWGLKGYKAAEEEVQAISKPTDSFTHSWENGGLGKWLTYSAGYLTGQVLETGAAAVAGAAIGSAVAPGAGTVGGAVGGAIEKGAVQAGLRSAINKMVEKETARLVAGKVAADAASEQAVKNVYRFIGATTANTFLNATQELGSIYGDAVEEAAKTGQEYSLGKVWLAGAAATAVDSWADAVGMSKLGKALGGKGGVGGIAMEAFKGGLREGLTEGAQTAIERWGANKDLDSKEAFREYIDSAAVGVLGGTVMGGGSAAVNKVLTPSQASPDAPGGTSSTNTDQTQDEVTGQRPGAPDVKLTPDEIRSRLDDVQVMAYLYQNSTAQDRRAIDRVMQSGNLIDEFLAARANQEEIQAGQKKYGEFTADQDKFMAEVRALAARAPSTPSSMPPAQTDPNDIASQDAMLQKSAAASSSNNANSTGLDKLRQMVGAIADSMYQAMFNAHAQGDVKVDGLPEPILMVAAQDNKQFADVNELKAFASDQTVLKRSNDIAQGLRVKKLLDSGQALEQIQARLPSVDVPAVLNAAQGFGVNEQAKQGGIRFSTAKPALQEPRPTKLEQATQEFKDAASQAFDVVADVTGAKLNITGKQYTVADLPAAIKRVMEALVKMGYYKLEDISVQLMKRMRANENWKGLADKVTPRMMREAYRSLSFPEKQSDKEVAAITADQLRNAVKRSEESDGQADAKKDSASKTSSDEDEEAPGVDYGTYKKQQTKEPAKKVPMSKLTEATRRWLGEKVGPASDKKKWQEGKKAQEEALEAMGRMSDEQLAKFQDNIKKMMEEREANKPPQKELPLKKPAQSEDEKKIQAGINRYRARVLGILNLMGSESGSYSESVSQAMTLREYLQSLQDRLDDINSSLNEGRVIRQDNQVFKGVDQSDENAYIFENFKDPAFIKNLPQDKLRAAADAIRQEIRDARSQMSSGLAKILRDSKKSEIGSMNARERIQYELSIARASAIQQGLPRGQVDRIFSDAQEAMGFFERESEARKKDQKAEGQQQPEVATMADTAIQEELFEPGDRLILQMVQDLRDKKLTPSQAFDFAQRGIRDKSFTYGDIVKMFEREGVSLPRQIMDLSGNIALNHRMVDYTKQHGGSPIARARWLSALEHVFRLSPALKLSPEFLTDAERLAYELWQERKAKLADRRRKDIVMDYSNDVREAFPDMLFTRYSLSQMDTMQGIPEREQVALGAFAQSREERREAWLQDVYMALLRRPDLKSQILGEDGLIAPTEVQQFNDWAEQKQRAVDVAAEAAARIPHFEKLKGMDHLFPESVRLAGGDSDIAPELRQPSQFDQLYMRIWTEDFARLESAMAKAQELEDALSDRNLSKDQVQKITDAFLEKVRVQEENDFDIDVNGTLGRSDRVTADEDASVDDLAADDEFDFSESFESTRYADSDEDASGDPREIRWHRTASRVHSQGMMHAHVVAEVAELTRDWKSAPGITVVTDVTMLPEPLRSAALAKLNGEATPKGLFDAETGHVYLFSENLAGPSDVAFTLFHEMYGHYGMRGLFGDRFDAFLENMYRLYPDVRREADALISRGTAKLEAIDEVLADMAGKNTKVPAVKSWVGRVLAGLREIGLDSVADWMAKVTNAELSFYLKGARMAAREAWYSPSETTPGMVRFMEAMHPRLYEMFSTSGNQTTMFARFNPVQQHWTVFTPANGTDIRDGANSEIVSDYAEVLSRMRRAGKVEFRKRSGLYMEKIPSDLLNFANVTNLPPVRRFIRTAITKLQNEYRPVFDLVEYVRRNSDVFDESMDVKLALENYERRTGARIEAMRNNMVKPLLNLVEQAGKLGADYGEINTYLLARHAEERNKQIARINPKMPDKGSGMYTDDANTFLAEVANKPYAKVLEEIGAITDRMSEYKLQYLYNTGMITHDQYQKMANYKHYVNLSGQNNTLDKMEDITRLVGNRFNVKGKEARAFGRSDAASDILANTILGLEVAVIRGQKNIVAQKLLAFLEAHYDANFATINEIAYKRQIGDDGMVMDVEDQDYIRNKDVMVAKVRGIPVTIKFKDTSPGSFAEAIHGAVYPKEASPWMNKLGWFNQKLGQMLTTWNPAWVAINGVRDVQTLFFNAAADERITKREAVRMMQLLLPAAKTAIYMSRTARGLPSRFNPDPALVRAYTEMRSSGGLTSFLNRKDTESQVDEIHDMLNELGKIRHTQETLKRVLEKVENFALPFEIAPRLAAYKVVRDKGFTAAEAAQFSGEITVNFNMRGSMKELRQLYIFFNPAVQGSAKLLSLFGELGPDYKLKLKAKGFAYVGLWIGLGALMNLVGRALSDDDEAGRNGLDKVPTYKRATSIVLKAEMPGGAIPIPYGWNAFYSMGHFAMDSLLGIQPLDVSAKRIAKAGFESFSPVGGAGLDSQTGVGTLAKGVAPTIALPIIEMLANENRYGAPIYREDSIFGGPKLPDSQMAFRSASPISRSATAFLNELTGGNQAKAGLIDMNPATIDHLIGSYLPGLANEAYKGASVAVRVSRGEEVKNTPMPLVDRFTAKIPEGFDAGAFRRAKEMTETLYNEYKLYPERRDEIRGEVPGLMRAHAIVASTTQEIRKVRAALSKAELPTSGLSDAEKVDMLNRMRARERELTNRAVKAVMEAGPKFRDAVMESD